MHIDILKSGLENLYALINRDSTRSDLAPVTEAEVTLGTPAVVSEDPLFNTSVLATAVAEGPYVGEYTFKYNRLALEAIATEAVSYTLQEGDTLETIKEAAAQAAGLLPEDVEFDITEVPTDETEGVVDGRFVATLQATAESFVYVGSIPVTIVLDGRIPLSEVFTKSELDGFELPVVEEGGDEEGGEEEPVQE